MGSTLLKLFWEFFRISLCVLGGGYAILSVADDVCARRGWTEEGELVEHLPIFQMVPGLIAGNTAVYVGNKLAGWFGAAVALFAVCLPSFIIFSFVSAGYEVIPVDNPWINSAYVGLRASITGVIAAVCWRSLKSAYKSYRGYFCSVGVIPLLFMKYGALAFGGGYVLIPFYMMDFVGPAAPYLQLATEEFMNVMALTQMTPGPISINCATFFGYRLGGLWGAGLATFALVLPNYILLLLVLKALKRYKNTRFVSVIMDFIRPFSLAMIIWALFSFAKFSIFRYNIISILLVIGTFILITRKKLGTMTIILMAALFATAVRADEVTLEKYPDADCVVMDQVEYTKYNADGTYEATNESWVKVLTEKGRREESNLTLHYNRRYGKAQIEFVGVIDEAGNEREIDFRQTMKESVDNGSENVNIYDPESRKVAAQIPGVKVNEIIHTKYSRVMNKARVENQFAEFSITEWQCPIMKTTVIVDAPKERPLKSKAVRHPIKDHITYTEEEQGDRIVYKWTTNFPAEQIFEDPDMPPVYTQVENVRYSTAANWEEISRWYWNVSAPHLARITDEMQAKVDEIGHDITLIYKWVAQEIRYMGLTMEDTAPGYAPHDIDITFNNRYGVCRDKAGLLVAMLRLAGFEAYPVLIHNGAKQDPDVPMPYFNHAIVCVKQNGEIILMDPTDESSKDIFPSYLSDKSYLVATPEGDPLRTSPLISPEQNSLKIRSTARLEPAGSVMMTMNIQFNGINDNAFRSSLVRKNHMEQRALFQRNLRSRYSGAELLDLHIEPKDLQDTTKPLTAEVSVRITEMMIHGETRDEVTLPMFSDGFGMANWLFNGRTSLEKRKYPLVIESTASVDEEIRLDFSEYIPHEVRFPKDINIEGKYAFSRTTHREGDTIVCNMKKTVAAVEFSPEEYLQVRDIEKQIEASKRERTIFEKDFTAGANVRYRLWSTETSFTLDGWVTTNKCIKEVLTYDGKKNSGELKFEFNPSWENIEIIEACVSNKNGKVAMLDMAHEVNVMDAAWVPSAKRYPASKRMIVSLPSVEVGSTIYYTTVETVKNPPVEFYNYWFFDVKSPTDELFVRCGDWSRRVICPKRLYPESMTAGGILWRDLYVVSSNNFTRQCAKLAPAIDIEPYSFPEAGKTVEEIRNWMSRNIRVVGPGLYEVPVESQLTKPEVILTERYANRLDYVRTMAAVLKGAGFEAELVFASLNSGDAENVKRWEMYEQPNVRLFNYPLLQVTENKGGYFFGLFGGESKVYWVGTENEYTPLGTTAFDGSNYFNPADDTFGTVVGDAAFAGSPTGETEMTVGEDGSVDMKVCETTVGVDVGAVRKLYSEMLPEDKSRHYQEMLSKFSSAAVAKSELKVDMTNYPAKVEFECHIPNYATVNDEMITVMIPDFYTQLFPLNESVRLNPIGIGAAGRDTASYDIVFPEGYTQVEHLPASYAFQDPVGNTGKWYENIVTKEVKDGRLVVHVKREAYDHVEVLLPTTTFGLLKDWSRIGSCRANRMIMVRKVK